MTANTITTIITEEPGKFCKKPISIFDLIKYKNNFQSFWVQFVEQFIPATTIFVAGERWCTTDEKICPSIDICDYDNAFELNDIGVININNPTNPTDDFISIGGGTSTPTIDTVDNFNPNSGGDYGDNTDDGVVIIDNVIGIYIPYRPYIIGRPIRVTVNDVRPLQNGLIDYRNRFTEKKVITLN